MKHALITGAAGFIGSHLVDRLLAEGWRVTGVDNFDPSYDPAIKRANVAAHRTNPCFRMVEADVRDLSVLRRDLPDRFDVIVHLAAKAGVRRSVEDAVGYQDVNVRGTQNLLELARERGVAQFVFASSSSVYGLNPNVPWREDDPVLRPISPYASTKVSGELMGHVYSHLYGIRFIALRFFTVYGPRQRPDLAIHKFARLLLEGKPLPVFGDGNTCRDYTYIADIIEGVRAAMDYAATPYEVINLGHHRPIALREMIHALERVSGLKAAIERHSLPPGDVPRTFADISKAEALLNFRPVTSFEDGLRRFWDWLCQPPNRP
ncbi:MAG: GDP-mannose 4,6-dehydratase [Bryobacterales bacterium]|nr:GDP-mannose 4,6-dehydratase [Bryobacteraceae bacterium]MDW8354866.1 GDP-mannose 4,6-dehydratase [Bryobacterales bacterium]